MRSHRTSRHFLAEQLERRVFLDGSLVADWAVGGIYYLKPTREVAALAAKPDGSLIARARRFSHDEFLYRLRADGQVDLNYGDINGSEPPGGFDVEAQSDNRLLYATRSGVARYSATGVREAEYRGPKLNSGTSPRLNAFTVLPDDSFAVAGGDDVQTARWQGIEWFNADGSHRMSIERSDTIVSLAGQSDGKLLALVMTDSGYTVNRYQSNGQLDGSFANGAALPAPTTEGFSSITRYSSISVDSRGRIYVGGHLPVTDADYTPFAIARLLPDGSLDLSYGSDGLATGWPTAVVGWGTAFRVAPDGRMYVAATVWPQEEDVNAAVWRLHEDGSPDRSWGELGAAVIDVTAAQAGATVGDLELMPDGDVVVSGSGSRIVLGESREVGFVFRLDVETNPAPAQIANRDGVVTIIGTTDSDMIAVRTLPDGQITATVNDLTEQFASSSVNGLVVYAGSGDDYIDIRDLAPIMSTVEDFPARLFGEAGDNVIIGSSGRDWIVGGDGTDRLAGMDGDDFINGLAGADWISGGAGTDSLVGSDGRDHLDGEAGDDTLYGGDQRDILAGGEGNDSLMGQGGHDQMDGGAGVDRFWGEGGNDAIFARDGAAETIIGGLAGLDSAHADEEDILFGIESPTIA